MRKALFFSCLFFSLFLHGSILGHLEGANTSMSSVRSAADKISVHIITDVLESSSSQQAEVVNKKVKSDARKLSGRNKIIRTAKIKGHLEVRYPMMSRYLKEEGTVKVRLRISKYGGVTSAKMVESSGFSRLDKEAMRKLLKAKFASQRNMINGVSTLGILSRYDCCISAG